MRLIKAFGLTAITAVAAMAFVGASSAMAANTALCKVNESPCAEANQVKTLHAVTTEEPTLLPIGFGTNIKCLSSLTKVNVLALGAPQVGHIEELVWTHCYRVDNGNLCEVVNELLGLLKALRTAANLADVESEGTSVLVRCGFLIHCTFKTIAGSKLHGLGAVAGGIKGHLTATEFKLETDNAHPVGICPNESRWDALYGASENVYITS